MTPPSTHANSPPQDAATHRQPSVRRDLPIADHLQTSRSEESLQRQQDEETQPPTTNSKQTSNSSPDVTVFPSSRDMRAAYHKDTSSGHNQHDAHARDDLRRAADVVQQPEEHQVRSRKRTEERTVTKGNVLKGSRLDISPPLTGKDSAYSSVSGGSFASPTAALPRSTSAQGSYPRAQFALFPSSNPGTPKLPISPRHGAMSPALSAPRPVEPAPQQPGPRSQSAFDNYSSSSRRLLKKSSLSSLKRLFSKKKHGGVDSIAE
jgi:hypothetical protein